MNHSNSSERMYRGGGRRHWSRMGRGCSLVCAAEEEEEDRAARGEAGRGISGEEEDEAQAHSWVAQADLRLL